MGLAHGSTMQVVVWAHDRHTNAFSWTILKFRPLLWATTPRRLSVFGGSMKRVLGTASKTVTTDLELPSDVPRKSKVFTIVHPIYD